MSEESVLCAMVNTTLLIILPVFVVTADAVTFAAFIVHTTADGAMRHAKCVVFCCVVLLPGMALMSRYSHYQNLQWTTKNG